MNLDPRELVDEQAFATLLGFVRGLGNAMCRDVIVTNENFKGEALLRYADASGQLERVAPR